MLGTSEKIEILGKEIGHLGKEIENINRKQMEILETEK